MNTRERLRHALDVANTQAIRERSKAKVWYDRRVKQCFATMNGRQGCRGYGISMGIPMRMNMGWVWEL